MKKKLVKKNGKLSNERCDAGDNIQNARANLLLRIDGGRQLDAVTNEISGKHGIEERLENVKHQANDTMYIINERKESLVE